ncbi:MAG: DUF4249 family protein [Ignavibacteria bacterium]
MYKYKFIAVFIIVILASFILSSCGEGTVDVAQSKYEQKIVIYGYIYPGRMVENIKLTRNFPLNTSIDITQIDLSGANAVITDIEAAKSYKLQFNPGKVSFEYPGADLIITAGKSYRIDVTADIDGKTLSASSTTRVPLEGFKIYEKNLPPMRYRELDSSGTVKNFTVNFKPSLNTDFYAVSIVPWQADRSTFIFDNAYLKLDSNKTPDNLDGYKYRARFLMNINSQAPKTEFKVEWIDTWFYGNYKLIIYVADKNFADFVVTNQSVQEPDGNFHEPKIHIEGDGIGVFGSAISDTAYFQILR